MMNKQQNMVVESTSQLPDLLDYNNNAASIHYFLHNLFRELKLVRRKYSLTINEIIFLNGMYLYCKHESTCISQDACLRFVGYYNLNKGKYYIGSLLSKDMIFVAEVIKGYNRYRLTQQGISVMDDIKDGFDKCLYEWLNKYGICL